MAEVDPITVVITSVGTEQQAVEISEELVLRRLATCVNVIPAQRSIYRWKGKICSDSELLLLIKTRSALFDRVVEAIHELHSYELPEILELPAGRVERMFHTWVAAMATGVAEPEDELAEAELGYE